MRTPITILNLIYRRVDCAVSKQPIQRSQAPISKLAYLACVPGGGFVTASMITQEEVRSELLIRACLGF